MVGETLLILAAALVFRVQIPTVWLAVPLAVTAVSNVLLGRFVVKFGARPALGVTLALDIVCLTALLALSGGPSNPFSLLYLVQITLSAVVLSKEWTWALGLPSVLGFGFTVQDSGTGMTPETLNRVSEPFFTIKGPGRGMGLGTFLVRVFAENLKGSLVFESEFNAGTTAVLELPLSTNDREARTRSAHRR